MKLQKNRRTILLFSMLLFPVTLNYLSPYLIIQGSFAGIVSGSFILFFSQFITSLIFGRAFCGWVCPAGAIQESCMQINGKPITNRKQSYIKYFIWAPWLIAIVMGFVSAGGIKQVDPLYFTDHGVSVTGLMNYIIYYFVVGLVLITALLFGRRSFCHSICWMAPFMIIGTKIKNTLKYPSLRLKAESTKCVNCKLCDKSCPMSLKVNDMVSSKNMNNNECILCCNCVSACPKKVISIGVKLP